jgi:hypothetical protein
MRVERLLRSLPKARAGFEGRLVGRDVKGDVPIPWVLRMVGLVAAVALSACGAGRDGSGRPSATTATRSPGESSSTTTSPAALRSGVEGTVRASPACPVERADQPCPAQPVDTELRLVRADGSIAARGHTGADGHFRIEVPPARYRLEAEYPEGPGRGCTPVDVAVEARRYTTADIDCDTGIR